MRHRIILADPPWLFNKRKYVKGKSFGQGVATRYSMGVMNIDSLCEMGPLIQRVATPDAYMFLWVSEAKPYYHLQLADAWGFRLVNTAFTWVKVNRNSGTPHFGTGKYSAGNIERCLLLRNKFSNCPCWHKTTKGCYKPSQIIRAPHPRENGKIIHSRKPDEVHETIEKWLDPYLKGFLKLELFATKPREGWTCLGHELSGKDIREELTTL